MKDAEKEEKTNLSKTDKATNERKAHMAAMAAKMKMEDVSEGDESDY